MTSLARIRQLPAPPCPPEPLVDLTRLAEVYRQAREHDRAAHDLRREGEAIIVAARDADVPVAKLAETAGLKIQRAYQILKAQHGGSNGNGSTTD